MKTGAVSLACAVFLAIAAGFRIPACAQAPAAPTHGQAAQGQGAGSDYQALQNLESKAQAASAAGDTKAASALARQLLHKNTDRTWWNYGNVVYEANQILGLAALKAGDVAAAKRDLLAAGRTPGSPQLDSFGPEMTLAQKLSARGERQAVLEFLDLVARFWATPKADTPEEFRGLYAEHAAMIRQWKAEIRAGRRPSLDRFDYPKTARDPRPVPALLAAGTPAPDFTVRDKDGRPLRLSDYKGKIVVLDFWATWCPPCQASLPHTAEIAGKYRGRGVVVLAVNVWDTEDAFQKWLPQHPQYSALTFAIDPTQQHGKDIATRLYNVSGIPTQYILDREGKIVRSIVGYGGPNSNLEDALKQAGAS